jgi:dihydrofolate reductase
VGNFIASLLSSVDGFDANDEFAPTAEEHQVFNDLFARAAAMICDRENYDLLVPYWDEIDLDDPDEDPVAREFGAIFRTRKRYVVSDDGQLADPLATRVQGDPIATLRDLKAASDETLLVAAGPGLLTPLIDHGLVDEVEILMLPIVLGEGRRQVGQLAQKRPLGLVEARALASGAVLLRYRVEAAAP